MYGICVYIYFKNYFFCVKPLRSPTQFSNAMELEIGFLSLTNKNLVLSDGVSLGIKATFKRRLTHSIEN